MTALILLRDWQKSQIEFWRPIPGIIGYDVSNFGNVRTRWKMDRRASRATLYTLTGEYEMVNLKVRSDSYTYVNIHLTVFSLHPLLHRVVASTFLPNSERLPVVNHKNHIRGDNRVDNLEWTDPQGNYEHARRNGTAALGERCGHTKLNPTKVREIRAELSAGEKTRQLSERYSVSVATIRLIRQHKVWAHVK